MGWLPWSVIVALCSCVDDYLCIPRKSHTIFPLHEGRSCNQKVVLRQWKCFTPLPWPASVSTLENVPALYSVSWEFFFYLLLALSMLPTDILDLAFGHCTFPVTGCLLRSHLRFITYRILLGCWTFWFYSICSVNQVSKFLPAHPANIPCIHILSWLSECPITHKINLPPFPFLFIFQVSIAPSWRIIQPILSLSGHLTSS